MCRKLSIERPYPIKYDAKAWDGKQTFN